MLEELDDLDTAFALESLDMDFDLSGGAYGDFVFARFHGAVGRLESTGGWIRQDRASILPMSDPETDGLILFYGLLDQIHPLARHLGLELGQHIVLHRPAGDLIADGSELHLG